MTTDTDCTKAHPEATTDRELLEAAARAAGIVGVWCDAGPGYVSGILLPDTMGDLWNALEFDRDAFRLAVKLGLQVNAASHAASGDGALWSAQSGERDPYAATRRVIVRAAAALAKEPT